MNLEVLKKSRKPLRPGDIFVLKPKEHPFVFGRVIRVEKVGGPTFYGFNLVYIYDAFSKERTSIPPFSCRNLLIPPQIINRLGWSRGYLETVGHQELTSEDVLPVHCFHSLRTGGYVDEFGNPLSGRVEPCDIFGLGNYATIALDVSRTLGIPDTEDED